MQSISESEDRRSRRQAKLDQIEIPEDEVEIMDLLGEGGFGQVRLANYMNENVAVKVCHDVTPRASSLQISWRTEIGFQQAGTQGK